VIAGCICRCSRRKPSGWAPLLIAAFINERVHFFFFTVCGCTETSWRHSFSLSLKMDPLIPRRDEGMIPTSGRPPPSDQIEIIWSYCLPVVIWKPGLIDGHLSPSRPAVMQWSSPVSLGETSSFLGGTQVSEWPSANETLLFFSFVFFLPSRWMREIFRVWWRSTPARTSSLIGRIDCLLLRHGLCKEDPATQQVARHSGAYEEDGGSRAV